MSMLFFNQLEFIVKKWLCSGCQYPTQITLLEKTMKDKEKSFWQSIEDISKRANSAELERNNLREEKVILQRELAALRISHTNLSEQLKNAMSTPHIPNPVNLPAPEWLDTTKTAYRPNIKTPNGAEVQIYPTEIYEPSFKLLKLLKDNKVFELPYEQKLMKIWELTINAGTYRYDASDEWNFAIQSHYTKQFDCEDGTIYFLTLAMLSGVPSNKVFNCCGWADKDTKHYYHSYPLAQNEKGEWMVYESTLDWLPSAPMRLLGSNYSIESAANWDKQGQMKNGVEQI